MLQLTRGAAVAGDVATAKMAEGGVTQEAAGRSPRDQEVPVADNGVAPAVGTPTAEQPGTTGKNGAESANSATRSMPRDLSTPDGFGSAPSTSGPTGVRRRLGRFASPRGGVNPVLEPLVKTVRTTHPKADVKLIERAYEVAARYHAGQLRKSGDPYITHPLAVATILAELGMKHDT